MISWENDSFLLSVLLFLPGFVSIKVYDLIIPGERRDFGGAAVEAVGFSAINFALLSWIIIPYLVYVDGTPWWTAVVVLVIVLAVGPVLWPVLLVWFLRSVLARRHFLGPVPKPWDEIVRRKGQCWMILHLKDGRSIGGRFGRDSMMSNFPAPEQLYVEEVWSLDERGAFDSKVERSGGMLVDAEDILVLEVLEP